jgi:hypothetical protein
MYKEHQNFKLPENNDEVIWRYMDLWKFEDLLKTQSLYFSTIKNMGDKFEGRIPYSIANIWSQKLKEKGCHSVADTINMLKSYAPVLDYNILSWNICKNESFALWKIYTKDSNAISIRSNIQRLKDSLQNNPFWQFIGVMNYYSDPSDFDFNSNIINLTINKFNYYHFENELRLLNIVPANLPIYSEIKKGEDIHVSVDLDCLIDSIYLAPNATQIQYDHVFKLLKDSGLEKEIMISGINDNWANI